MIWMAVAIENLMGARSESIGDLIERFDEGAMPKFANTRAWEQTELLMQPILIRVIDNIGKQLETSLWKGTYQEEPIWPESVSDATKAQVAQLQAQLSTASPEAAIDIQEALARLPSPHPGYLLCLQWQNRQVTVDIWQLCYQICFRNYSPVLNAMDSELIVEVDTSLIDDQGEVDWQRLDTKAKQYIGQIFASLAGNDAVAESAELAELSERSESDRSKSGDSVETNESPDEG
jgi:hypothetical protein